MLGLDDAQVNVYTCSWYWYCPCGRYRFLSLDLLRHVISFFLPLRQSPSGSRACYGRKVVTTFEDIIHEDPQIPSSGIMVGVHRCWACRGCALPKRLLNSDMNVKVSLSIDGFCALAFILLVAVCVSILARPLRVSSTWSAASAFLVFRHGRTTGSVSYTSAGTRSLHVKHGCVVEGRHRTEVSERRYRARSCHNLATLSP